VNIKLILTVCRFFSRYSFSPQSRPGTEIDGRIDNVVLLAGLEAV
jgi:hypothetical protein